jgi:hypothetical protein
MYNMPGHFLQSRHFGFPIQISILCICIPEVQWPASFSISSQAFTSLDTRVGAWWDKCVDLYEIPTTGALHYIIRILQLQWKHIQASPKIQMITILYLCKNHFIIILTHLQHQLQVIIRFKYNFNLLYLLIT